ncbi:DNA polymerase III subunit gamma/tau [Chengkuizengella sediminis]|uniref:DNA polymerase III subunit gamma/tau n=1 Tax=Chengkuizengella sediminis TaxID=1885917 RepID=UPI001389CEAD|nr:DNA polymerase III subunit gamma/tau [Chengkuizengella sediminis]NDI34800.1 DNA polymerase III subunit gamma/tau [Chengkuizengella sediminis]
MSHIALYRKWRSQTFQEVVGQKHIVQTLQNSLKENRFTHAYLFSGPRGTGKTSTAKIFAKALNCESGPSMEPCNQCNACKRITEGAVMDVMEIDAASNRGVEEIRDIRDKVKYAPTEVKYKVYIIDEVHMLTTEAFNALLKTLEEPPAHVVFILATTEPHRIPATIISRCQRFDFRRVAIEEQEKRMRLICEQENISIDDDALQYIARLSDGGMRDALSLLDQIVSFSGQHISYEQVIDATGGIESSQFLKIAEAVKQQNVSQILELMNRLMQEGKNADKCLESLIYYYRDLLVIKMVDQAQDVTDRVLDVSSYSNLAEVYENEEVFQIIDTLNQYQVEMKYASNPQTLLEIAVMKICTLNVQEQSSIPLQKPSSKIETNKKPNDRQTNFNDPSIATLIQRVEELEKQISKWEKAGGVESRPSSTNEKKHINTPKQPIAKLNRQSKEKLLGFLNEKEQDAFKRILLKWSQVLNLVKSKKITIHAWLVDGEPVSVKNNMVLVAFKNTIHRETTEKQTNKQIIEEVLHEVYNEPIQLKTVMLKDWNELESIEAQGTQKTEQTESLELVPEDQENEEKQKGWVDEAVQLFGSDLVQIDEEK